MSKVPAMSSCAADVEPEAGVGRRRCAHGGDRILGIGGPRCAGATHQCDAGGERDDLRAPSRQRRWVGAHACDSRLSWSLREVFICVSLLVDRWW